MNSAVVRRKAHCAFLEGSDAPARFVVLVAHPLDTGPAVAVHGSTGLGERVWRRQSQRITTPPHQNTRPGRSKPTVTCTSEGIEFIRNLKHIKTGTRRPPTLARTTTSRSRQSHHRYRVAGCGGDSPIHSR